MPRDGNERTRSLDTAPQLPLAWRSWNLITSSAVVTSLRRRKWPSTTLLKKIKPNILNVRRHNVQVSDVDSPRSKIGKIAVTTIREAIEGQVETT